MHVNRLAHEKSPYLLQHVHNPVDWYPWGEEAFEKARREDKPIFLSAGYSTCHWCHVMERESFEDAQLAELLNRHFVPVKLDREERPDVDRIYMLFVQATTGSGGWPMSVWLTPDLKPFFGGTYFPPDNRYGRPGFRHILERIAEAWTHERDRLVRSGQEILGELERHTAIASNSTHLDQFVLETGFFQFRRSFDPKYGGFGGAPKFPRPSAYSFLLREYARTGNREALEMVLQTLRAMARGGMNDQLGGGFHRYSVDERWFVPHFEKMLYDQAQLAVSYLEAFQITGEESYAAVARSVLDYVLRDMTHPEGGFYSAEDADSVIDAAEPDVKREGAFYLWTRTEIESQLVRPAAEWLCHYYGVGDGGNVREDPHGEFAGKNILYEAHIVEETAAWFGVSPGEVREALAAARQTLLAFRSGRPRPHLDDKILTGWNGLMITAFALATQVLGDPRYLEAARRSANFMLATMYNPETRMLLRRYRDGAAAIPGFLDDYAFFTQALLDLYEADFDVRWLEAALRLMTKTTELFADQKDGGFFSTAEGDASLVLRLKDDYDGAEPSGNSVVAMNLLRLAQMTGNEEFHRAAERTLGVFASHLKTAPTALPQMLVSLGFALSKSKQIILAGERDAPDTHALLRVVRRRFLPNKIVLLADSGVSRFLPVVNSMTPISGRAAAYVCEDYTCKLPVTSEDELAALLE